jgi:hypothetical protein
VTRSLALVLALAACGRPVDLVATASDAAPDGPGDRPPLDSGVLEAQSPTPPAIPRVACPPGTMVIVLGEGNVVYAFDPKNEQLAMLGTVTCPELGSRKLRAVAVGDDTLIYFVTDDGLIILVPPGTPPQGCKVWGKAPGPPTANVGFTLLGSGGNPLVYYGVDEVLYQMPNGPSNWQLVGKLDPTDLVEALVGSGDNRLYAVLPPATKTAWRVARLDPIRAAVGGTVLVPTGPLAPDPSGPVGFALWGDTLLVFMQKAVVTYAFSTGDVGAPTLVPIGTPVLGAASPPCASTVD